MGETTESYLQKRYRIVKYYNPWVRNSVSTADGKPSVWRPLVSPVLDFLLAVCDGSSVPPSKMVPVDFVTRHYQSESFYLLLCDQYRWYYLSKQTKDEVPDDEDL
jgi:hypothetical protein